MTLLQAVFVDKTRALDVDMTAAAPLPVSAALTEAQGGERHLCMELRPMEASCSVLRW